MASLAMLSSSPFVEPPAGWNKALSGIFGSISLTAWICLLVPQLIKNYKAQSAEALSMAFLFVWLSGDIANLSGAFFTDLAPTAVTIGCYFIFADIVLVSQCVYYNKKNARKALRTRRRNSSHASVDSEEAPLLSGRRRSTHSVHAATGDTGMETVGKIIAGDDYEQENPSLWHNVLSLLAVYAVGVAAWLISYMVGGWDSGDVDMEPPQADDMAHTIGMALGYLSASFYLCARVPQIIKNHREKSCEGLAMLFFLLSLTGNLMYGLSLVSYDPSREQLIKDLPWLLGSIGTIVQDCVIFVQFQIYAPHRRQNPSNQVA